MKKKKLLIHTCPVHAPPHPPRLPSLLFSYQLFICSFPSKITFVYHHWSIPAPGCCIRTSSEHTGVTRERMKRRSREEEKMRCIITDVGRHKTLKTTTKLAARAVAMYNICLRCWFLSDFTGSRFVPVATLKPTFGFTVGDSLYANGFDLFPFMHRNKQTNKRTKNTLYFVSLLWVSAWFCRRL